MATRRRQRPLGPRPQKGPGVDKSIRLHGLRHWQATQLLDSGVPLPTVAARLGHASGMTTMKIYAHWTAQADEYVSLGRRRRTRRRGLRAQSTSAHPIAILGVTRRVAAGYWAAGRRWSGTVGVPRWGATSATLRRRYQCQNLFRSHW
ncbi:MAG: tyrosine-type recombinase/integrase [Actinomycetia bacterium]|nr:tyrosine-type recombinase/integrase [Actinomycetes bacterium]